LRFDTRRLTGIVYLLFDCSAGGRGVSLGAPVSRAIAANGGFGMPPTALGNADEHIFHQ